VTAFPSAGISTPPAADDFPSPVSSYWCNRDEREASMSRLNLTQVGRVAVSVSDTDRALDFYVGTLGFEKIVDLPMGDAGRWVEVQLNGTPTTIAIAPPPPGKPAGGTDTGIILDSTDVDADHAALKAAGVDVDDEVSRYGGEIPPMFWVRDPDKNALIIVQPNR
jgi:catechol 2,3-dioxygenase-like lactoylglutathione lyase family enzyme